MNPLSVFVASKPVCGCECDSECLSCANASEDNMLPLRISWTKDSLNVHQDLATVLLELCNMLEALPTLGQCKGDWPASAAHLLN